MKRRKVVGNLLCIFSLFLFISNVQAKKDVYFVNSNDVEFTKAEYDFISYMFWDGVQDYMSLDDYNEFIESDIMNGTIDSVMYDYPLTRATSIEDANRALKIVKSCSSNCFVSVTLTWKSLPTIRSYDVIGAYLDGTELENTPTTTISTGGQLLSFKDIKKANNGFGVSIKLPTYGNSMVINQNYRVSSSGNVYASYQHAMKNISLSNSQNYTFSRSGYGGVFKFSGTALTTYDKMNGVNISL
mgnify:CR=1 FL=1